MHDVRIDPLKNRLYIAMGAWNYADNAAYINDIESACKDLVPGFTCLTVFKKNGIVRQSDRDLLFNTADLVYAYGAGKIVHVKKDNDTLGFLQDGLMGFQTDFQVKNAKISGKQKIFWMEKNQASKYAGSIPTSSGLGLAPMEDICRAST